MERSISISELSAENAYRSIIGDDEDHGDDSTTEVYWYLTKSPQWKYRLFGLKFEKLIWPVLFSANIDLNWPYTFWDRTYCRFYWLQDTGQNIRYSGVNCPLGPSKTIRYSGDFVIAKGRYSRVRFDIFYCNSAGLSNVFRYNGVFVAAGFVIAGCHCKWVRSSAYACAYVAGVLTCFCLCLCAGESQP